MFSIPVSTECYTHCTNQISKYNLGERKESNGTPEQQLTGAIGQSIISDLFGLGYIDASNGFDNGIDIPYNELKIDVKTMGRKFYPKQDWVNNFYKCQDHYKTNIYIFCSYNKVSNVITVCGWIDKETFTKKRAIYLKGDKRTRDNGSVFILDTDTYEIKNSDLNQCYSFNQLKQQLDMYLLSKF